MLRRLIDDTRLPRQGPARAKRERDAGRARRLVRRAAVALAGQASRAYFLPLVTVLLSTAARIDALLEPDLLNA